MGAAESCELIPTHRDRVAVRHVAPGEKAMDEQPNIIPITRGKPSRLQLTLTSDATGINVQLQRIRTDAGQWSGGTSASNTNGPGKVFEFKRPSQEGKTNMNRYTIAEDNHVHAVASTESNDSVFAGEQELQQLAGDWPMCRLVAVWNQLPGVRAVARFENRSVAVRRIWQALKQPTQDRSRRRNEKGKQARRESKLQLVLKLLCTPEGATLPALMKVTRWQAHSVRGFLSGKVSKHLGLPLESFQRDGDRVYRLPAAQ